MVVVMPLVNLEDWEFELRGQVFNLLATPLRVAQILVLQLQGLLAGQRVHPSLEQLACLTVIVLAFADVGQFALKEVWVFCVLTLLMYE